MPAHKRLADHPYSLSAETGDTDSRSTGVVDNDARKAGDDIGLSSSRGHGASSADGTNESVASSERGGSSQKRDKKEERCLYSGVRLPNLSPNIQRLLKEAGRLPIDDNYATECILARVILELSVSDPKVLMWSGKTEGDKLADKIRACIFKLDPQIDSPGKRARQDLVQAHLETKEIGVAYLHQFMHNPSAKSDPHLARRFSTAFTPLLNSIDEAVK